MLECMIPMSLPVTIPGCLRTTLMDGKQHVPFINSVQLWSNHIPRQVGEYAFTWYEQIQPTVTLTVEL